MSTQQLIYESVIPLSKDRHGDWSVEVGRDHSHSKNLQFVPVLAGEFTAVSREYPIVFSKSEDGYQPLALLGMRKSENLYLTESNGWSAKYLPAFLRRYPFVFARSQDGGTFTLCIDEKFSGFNQHGRGQRLFTEKKEPSPYVNGILEFLKTFQAEHVRSQAFCRRLDEWDLFESNNAVWTGPDGQKAAVTNFFVINQSKLSELAPKVLANMIKSGEMGMVYAHLFSLENFNALKDKLVVRQS